MSEVLISRDTWSGSRRQTQLGWLDLLQAQGSGSGGSGFWLWRRPLSKFRFLSELNSAVTWGSEKRLLYRLLPLLLRMTLMAVVYTAWISTLLHGLCSLESWRRAALQMRPRCAKGEMPGRVNLNLCGGSKSCIPRHSDNEPMLGGVGDSELIVSVSFDVDATFRRARNSDRDESSGWSQRLSHCDVFVKDGEPGIILNTGLRLVRRAYGSV